MIICRGPRAADVGRKSLSSIASFTPTSDGQHEDRIHFRHVAVQGDVAARTSANHKLALVSEGPTYLRIGFQDIQRLDDFADSRRCVFSVMLGERVEDAIEVIADLGSKLDPCHCALLSRHLAGHRPARLPACQPSLQV